jgi:hemerythrin-like domain-containing protein
MTLSVRTGFSSPVSVAELGIRVDDPIEHLRDCHQKIERSLVIVQNAVAALRLTEPVLRAEAAAALDYELALLRLLENLHTQDEEQSFFPRLRAKLLEDPCDLQELMLSLELQHRQDEATFEELAACMRGFLGSPGERSEERLGQLEGLVAQLAGLCGPHMILENERLIANSRQYLTATDLDEMRQEIRSRFRG